MDMEESVKERVYLAEYNASFWNPEAVSKVQKNRKMNEESSMIDEDEFMNINKKLNDENKSLIDAIKKIRNNDLSKNKENSSINLNKLIKDTL